MSTHRGHFSSTKKLYSDSKSINILHAQDGYYEMRDNRVFAGCAKASFVYDLAEPPKEGIAFKLHKIPVKILKQIISFFKENCSVNDNEVNEVMVQIFFNFDANEYFVVVPKQRVKLARIDYIYPIMDDSSELVVTIHSHPVFDACFSRTDNDDEKATGLYVVIGHLERPIPDIMLRASIGGNFILLNVWDLFENIFEEEYPTEWHKNVTIISSSAEEIEAACSYI